MQNPFELIRHGGFMMAPLLVSALVALTIIFERLYYFQKHYSISDIQIVEIETAVRAKNIDAKWTLIKKHESPIYDIYLEGTHSFSLSSDLLEKALQRKAMSWIPKLEKRLEILDTIITAAPLMGLLGTITGMMASFQVLSTSGVNEPNAITGGVAEALIATATGLIIALISLVFYNYFNSKVKSTLDKMEYIGNLFEEKKSLLENQR